MEIICITIIRANSMFGDVELYCVIRLLYAEHLDI